MEPDPASHRHDRKYHADTQGDPESQVKALGPEELNSTTDQTSHSSMLNPRPEANAMTARTAVLVLKMSNCQKV